jgi:nucleotide-binding universal stress UspA family protein
MAEQGPALVAVAGAETGRFWEQVRMLLPVGVPVEVYHVVDEAPLRELGMQFARRPGHPPLPGLDARVRDAETRGSDAILAGARDAIGRASTAAVGRGHPEREIVARAGNIGAALVVVGARPGEDRTPPEPHSLGHVSRFVVDHAPCPVLLIRL